MTFATPRHHVFYGALSLIFLLGVLALGLPVHAAELTPGFELDEGAVSARFDADEIEEKYLVVTLANSFEGIAGIILRDPSQEKDLVRIAASSAAELLNGALYPREAIASLTIEGDEVEGSFQVRLEASLEGVEHLQVVLIDREARVQPIDVFGSTWIGSSFSFERDSAEDVQCRKVSISCTRPGNTPCNKTVTCCGNLSVCVDCTKCEVVCPPCVRYPDPHSP